MIPLDEDLDDDELCELHEFLASPGLVETSFGIVGLDGFFASIVSCPRLVMPSEWMPWIWDAERGEVAPDFADLEQAQRVFGLVMRYYNSVARALQAALVEFEPPSESGDSEAAAAWCAGFIVGMRLEQDAWAPLIDDQPKWFDAIFGLGFDDDEGPRPRKAQVDRWTRAVGPAVAKIHTYRLERQRARPPGVTADRFPVGSGPRPRPSSPTAGRNDPCPCGSGRKLKHCCGARSPKRAD